MKGSVVLGILALLLCGTVICSADNTVAEITTNDLYAATLQRGDIIFANQCTDWWQKYPEFYLDFDPLPGEKFYVVQQFAKVNGDDEVIQNALTYFTDEKSAKKGYLTKIGDDVKGAVHVDGPVLGDECCYTSGKNSDFSHIVTARFRVGRVVGRLTVMSRIRDYTPDELALYTEPTIQRIRMLLSGNMKAQPIARRTEAIMPPASAVETVGPLMGSAPVSLDAWALEDTSHDPVDAKQTLQDGGVSHLLYQVYRIKADPSQIAAVTLMTFKDAESANDWLKVFIAEESYGKRLDAGKTGAISAYRYSEKLQFYELQFANGRYVCDISGYAPFTDTSSACQGPVRELAEMWYQQILNK